MTGRRKPDFKPAILHGFHFAAAILTVLTLAPFIALLQAKRSKILFVHGSRIGGASVFLTVLTLAPFIAFL